MRTLLRRDQIDLQVEIQESLPTINCNSGQIQQVVINLMTNARDAFNQRFSRPAQVKTMKLTVKMVPAKGSQFVRISVEDFGVGIPEQVRDRMFDPFFTTKDRTMGTGLGLSISHGIIQEHKGRISVESELARFTQFDIDLPVDSESVSD